MKYRPEQAKRKMDRGRSVKKKRVIVGEAEEDEVGEGVDIKMEM